MSGSLIARLTLALRLLAVGLGVLWMYASHRYDCLNIGPCTGDPGFWDRIVGWACYGFLGAWAGLVVLAAFDRAANSRAAFATWTCALAFLFLAANPVADAKKPPAEDPDIKPAYFDPDGKGDVATAVIWGTRNILIASVNGKMAPRYRGKGAVGLHMPAGTYEVKYYVDMPVSPYHLVTVTMEPGHTYRLSWDQVGAAAPTFELVDLGTEARCTAYYSLSARTPVVFC